MKKLVYFILLGMLVSIFTISSEVSLALPFSAEVSNAVRDIEMQNPTTGSYTNITVKFTNFNVVQELYLHEIIPAGWGLTRISDDAWSFTPGTHEWYWNIVLADATKTVVYRLYVPSNAIPGIYNIGGTVSNSSGIIAIVAGENSVNVISTITSTPVPVPDITQPLLIVDQPINGQIFTFNSITVSGTVTDASGIANIKVNGNPVTVSPAGSFSTTVTLANGSNTITITATDSSPNANTATVTRTVTYIPPVASDTTPPLLIVTEPVNNQVFNINSITVSGTATDASGIANVKVNGNPVTVSLAGSFSTTATLANGSNTIMITVTDSSPNANTATVTRTVTYKPPVASDTTPPLLIVTEPVNNQVFNTNSITVRGTATDASGIANVKVNGNPVTVSSTGSFSTIVTLANGSNTITITATDSSPNANTATVTRTVTYNPPVAPDTTPPLLIVTEPVNDQVFNTNSITVRGTATDAGGIANIKVNGNTVTVSPAGSFSTTVTLANGSNTITITATDSSPNANTATVTRTVTYKPPVASDTTPPLLIATEPVNNQVFNTNSITVSGTATDASGIANVKVNGNTVTVSPAGSFSTTVTLANGNNTITITVTDSSPNANTATVTRTVTYKPPVVPDTTPPILIVTQPINNHRYTTDSITVRGIVTDASGIYSVTVNGAPATITGNSFSFSLTLNAGTNTIEVEAVDSSSNYNRVSVTRTFIYEPPVVIDTVPPSLVVNQPGNGKDFETNLITVSGSAQDRSGIYSVSVNGAIIAVNAGPFSTNVYLTPGTNTITVVATDRAGNTASATRTVTYTPPVVADTTPPSLIVSQPRNGKNFETNSITVSGTAYDASGLYSVSVNGNYVPLSSTGSFSTPLILTKGSNTITIAATDASTNANTAIITRTVTYTPLVDADIEPPLIILKQPKDGQVFTTSTITVSGKAVDDSDIRSVAVNGIPATLTDDGAFGITVELNIGSNTIEIQAIDSSDNLNTNTKTLTVTRIIPPDTVPPTLIVMFPTEGLVIESSNNTIEVSGTVSDNTGVKSVTVNGIMATIVDESFSVFLPLNPGQNILTIIATDNSTNHNLKTITRNVRYVVPASGPGVAANISIISNPGILKADGRQSANIVAHVTDAKGIDVSDGTNVSFSTSDGMLYKRKEDVGEVPGKTTLTTRTKNGRARVVILSSTRPGTAVVTAQVLTNGISTTLNVPLKATSYLKDKSDDTTLLITHSPGFPADNSSIELNGGIGYIRTSTEIAIGIVNGTHISYNIGTATIDIVIINPIINGDQVIFTVESLMLNGSTITSNFTGIGSVASHVDVGINTTSQLSGMTFVMSLYPAIADELNARGGADAGLVDINTILTNLESTLDMQNVENRTAFVTSAQLDGATMQDILEVPVSMTVSGNWYRNTAASIPGNVRLAKIYSNGTVGMIQTPQSFAFDPLNDSYTFVFRMKGFSTFALIGKTVSTPIETATLSSSGGGGGGNSGENVSNIEVIEKYNMQISRDAMTSYRFIHEKNPIMFVNITGNTSLGMITTSVEVLKDTSTIVKTPAQGLVYKNANIWVGTSEYATPKNIKEAHIKFRVLNSWINDNNLASDDVKLLKWDGSKWTQLETTQEKTDAVHTYYDAKTYSFSHFAISGVKGVVIPAATPAITETLVSNPLTREGTATPQEKTYSTTEWLTALTGLGLPTTGGNANASLIYALIIVLIIAVAVRFGLVFYIQQRKKKKE